MKTLLVAIAYFAVVYSQDTSSCSEVITYDKEKSVPGEWFGSINLKSEFPLTGIWIRVILDKKVAAFESEFEILDRGETEYLLRNKDYNLQDEQLTVPFSVKYDKNEPAPNIVGVRLNGRSVCPAKEIEQITACPAIYSQNEDKVLKNRWYGTLSLNSEFELYGIWTRVILDQPAESLGNEFGEVLTLNEKNSFLIRNRNYTLVPGQPLTIPFWVNYSPEGPIPKIKSVRLNGRAVCETK